jgi:hypothetical protein
MQQLKQSKASVSNSQHDSKEKCLSALLKLLVPKHYLFSFCLIKHKNLLSENSYVISQATLEFFVAQR